LYSNELTRLCAREDYIELFWDITQRRVVILYRSFGTTYRTGFICLRIGRSNGFCEDLNKPSGSVKFEECLEYLRKPWRPLLCS
jgi:hypothetical protein